MRTLIVSNMYPVSLNKKIGLWAHKQTIGILRYVDEVKVIAIRPFIPKFLKNFHRMNKWATLEEKISIDNIKINNVKTFTYGFGNFLNRFYFYNPALHELLTWLPVKRLIIDILEKYRPSIMIAHNAFPAGFICMKIKKLSNIPYITFFHSFVELKKINKSLKPYYQEIIDNSKIIITVSHKMQNKLESLFKIKNIKIVRNGYDPDELNIQADNKLFEDYFEMTNNSKFILSIGALNLRKGHYDLLKAINYFVTKYPEKKSKLKCLIVGEGSLMNKYLNYINSNDLKSNIQILNYQSRKRLNQLMKRADLFILPSWDEPCATVYSEVMAHGTPIVAIKNEGFSEQIKHKINGYLIEKNNYYDISEIIVLLFEKPHLIKNVGKNGKIFVSKKLSWEAIGNNIVNVIKSS